MENAPREVSCGDLSGISRKWSLCAGTSRSLGGPAGTESSLLPLGGRLAQPTPWGSSCSNSVLIRKVGVPLGSPGIASRLLARASGGLTRGSWWGWRGAPWPIAEPRGGLLTRCAERCCNHGQRPEVQAKCQGLLQSDTAAGLKAASSQQGKVGRGAQAPGGGLVLGQRLSGWLALY